MSRASFRFVWKNTSKSTFLNLEFPTELNDFDKLFLQKSCLSPINYNFFNTRVFIAKSSRWRKLEGAKGGRRVRNNKIPGRRISVARSRLRERRAIKRGFPSTSADGSGTACASTMLCIQPLFFTPSHGRSGRRTCTEGFIVLTEIARVLVNCKAFASYLKGGAKEIAYDQSLFFSFSHLSIHFCKVFDKMAEIFYSKWYNTRRGKNGGSFVIICDKLTRVPYLSFL